MCAKNRRGLFVDYEYLHKILERTYQINPDPRQITDAINENLSEHTKEMVFQKVYALWNDHEAVKLVFTDEGYDTVDTLCGTTDTDDLNNGRGLDASFNAIEMVISCDIMESLSNQELTDYHLLLGNGGYEVVIRKLQDKGCKAHLLGFTKLTPVNLKQLADSFIGLDALLKQFHTEDIASIVDTFISLSHKLPYVGYKYLMDILSRNNLHTDYRQLLNDAQEEGIIRLVEVDDPNTVRGKAFAVRLVPEHPAIAKHLQEMGLTAESISSPASVQIRENSEPEAGDYFTSEDHGDSRFVAGKHLVEIGQHEAAISEFFNYLEDYPNDFLGFVYVINCLIKSGDRKQARAWCKKALDLPNSAHNQKEYPRWFTYMKRISSAEIEPIMDEEEKIELSG